MNATISALACDCRALSHEQLATELAYALVALCKVRDFNRINEPGLAEGIADNAIHASRLAEVLL